MALNCTNCGAPLKLIEGREYFICDYCGCYQFAEDATEGIRLLGEDGKYTCPVCKERLELGSLADCRVEVCPTCRGILAHQMVFFTMLTFIRSMILSPELPVRKLDMSQLSREIYCPSCKKRMDTHPYLGPGNVVIDNCIRCELVWLDHGEMTRILLTGKRTPRRS